VILHNEQLISLAPFSYFYLNFLKDDNQVKWWRIYSLISDTN